MLNDKDGQCVCFATLDDDEDVLAQVEIILANPAADWRPAKDPPGRRK
jgi:hypothetical protein